MTDSNVDALQEAGFGSTTKCPRLRSCEIGPSCDFDSGSETHKHHKAQGGAGGYVSVVARVPPKFDTIGVCVGGGGVAGWIITDVHGISEDPHFPLPPDLLPNRAERASAGTGGAVHGASGDAVDKCSELEGGSSLTQAPECNIGPLSIGNVGDLPMAFTEIQECYGGGGGAATGVYALDSVSGDWEWLAVAPGGGGGTFRGVAGGSGTLAKGRKETESGRKGADGAKGGDGGGGGGYGTSPKDPGAGGDGYFNKRLALDPVSLVASDAPFHCHFQPGMWSESYLEPVLGCVIDGSEREETCLTLIANSAADCEAAVRSKGQSRGCTSKGAKCQVPDNADGIVFLPSGEDGGECYVSVGHPSNLLADFGVHVVGALHCDMKDDPALVSSGYASHANEALGPLPPVDVDRAGDVDSTTLTGRKSAVGARGFMSGAHTFEDTTGTREAAFLYSPMTIDPDYIEPDVRGIKHPWHGFQRPGDGFARAKEDMTSGIYADAWVTVKTTCSCVIEASTEDDADPDGRPRHFVARQSYNKVFFSFHDYSGCEEGFQFYRGGMLLDAEFQARGQCFEVLAPSHIGDLLTTTNDKKKLVIPPGSTHTYCVKAVGSPVGEVAAGYASGRTCTDLTVKWGAAVTGIIRSQADQTIGVSGVLVSVYLLTEQEHDNGAVREWSFRSTGSRRARAAGNATVPETTPTPPGFRVQPPARSTQRSRRQDTGQACPPELALDENSLPIHGFWPETGSGQTVSLPCPDLGLGVSVLNRTCSNAGNWGETDGECAPVLVQFTRPQAVFVRLENIKFAANRHLLYNTDPATCAWHCLTLNTTCRSFEVFRGDTQPICFISSVHSNDTDVAFLPARFGSIQYYELANPALRDTFEVLDQDLVDLYVPTYTNVCSIEVLAAQGDWPYDPESSTHYMDQHQHLRQIEAEGCDKVEGNLILRCHEGCDYRLRRALATFGAVMTPADGRTFCGAPPSPNGAWQNYTIERMGAELTAICDAKVLMAHCLTHFLQGNFLTVRILRVMGLLRR